jgi:hypothetical protein
VLGLNGCEGVLSTAGTYHFTDNTVEYTPRGYAGQAVKVRKLGVGSGSAVVAPLRKIFGKRGRVSAIVRWPRLPKPLAYKSHHVGMVFNKSRVRNSQPSTFGGQLRTGDGGSAAGARAPGCDLPAGFCDGEGYEDYIDRVLVLEDESVAFVEASRRAAFQDV